MRPIHRYCLATGSWFAAHGVQNVLFAWLVTMVLHETPQMVGVAQMALLVPVTVLMLLGGSIADVIGPRRAWPCWPRGSRCCRESPCCWCWPWTASTFAPWCSMRGGDGFVRRPFVTPARDGLLNHVAEGRIQRTVVIVSLTQFGVQMVGFIVAGFAGVLGPEAVVAFQVVVLSLGILAYRRLPAPLPLRIGGPALRDLTDAIAEGCRTVLRSDAMRPVVVQNFAMGLFFMGSYIVTMPLLIREVYSGSSADLAMVNAANALGLVTSIVALLLGGGLRRQGRALLTAHALGCVFLAAAGAGLGFPAVVACVYLWGACGGVAMSMSRTIMQQAAPDGQRGRVMAFFSFSFMGAGPVGALLCGYLVSAVGAPAALLAASAALLAVVVAVARRSALWNMRMSEPAAPGIRQTRTASR